MGTRNMTLVWYQGQYQLAQYGQLDGYPRGQGATVLEFLHKIKQGDKKSSLTQAFLFNLLAAKEANQHMIDRYIRSLGATDGWMTQEQAEKFQKRYPQLSVDMGAEILDFILTEAPGVEINSKSDISFCADSLHCEWTYVLNFDDKKLEVYEGYNKEPLDPTERFACLTNRRQHRKYYPVKFKHAFAFASLPNEKDFVKILEGQQADAVA